VRHGEDRREARRWLSDDDLRLGNEQEDVEDGQQVAAGYADENGEIGHVRCLCGE